MKGLTFSGAVVIAALALPAVAVASDAPATPSIVLAGFTSQQYPTFFKIAAAGRSVTLGAVALEMTCTSGAQFVLQDGFGPRPDQPRAARFTSRSRYRRRPDRAA